MESAPKPPPESPPIKRHIKRSCRYPAARERLIQAGGTEARRMLKRGGMINDGP